jgi:hypothetical protein
MWHRAATYVHSWIVFVRHFCAYRFKKHGAGGQSTWTAFRLAALSRYGIYHQHYAKGKVPFGAPMAKKNPNNTQGAKR